jgi:hypothetical protein
MARNRKKPAFDMKGKRIALPLQGYSITEIIGEARPTLVFNDPKQSKIDVQGEFEITAAGWNESYEPLDPASIPALESLQLVEVLEARASRRGPLEIRFVDGRALIVPYGPFENWLYSNSDGVSLYGGF